MLIQGFNLTIWTMRHWLLASRLNRQNRGNLCVVIGKLMSPTAMILAILLSIVFLCSFVFFPPCLSLSVVLLNNILLPFVGVSCSYYLLYTVGCYMVCMYLTGNSVCHSQQEEPIMRLAIVCFLFP